MSSFFDQAVPATDSYDDLLFQSEAFASFSEDCFDDAKSINKLAALFGSPSTDDSTAYPVNVTATTTNNTTSAAPTRRAYSSELALNSNVDLDLMMIIADVSSGPAAAAAAPSMGTDDSNLFPPEEALQSEGTAFGDLDMFSHPTEEDVAVATESANLAAAAAAASARHATDAATSAAFRPDHTNMDIEEPSVSPAAILTAPAAAAVAPSFVTKMEADNDDSSVDDDTNASGPSSPLPSSSDSRSSSPQPASSLSAVSDSSLSASRRSMTPLSHRPRLHRVHNDYSAYTDDASSTVSSPMSPGLGSTVGLSFPADLHIVYNASIPELNKYMDRERFTHQQRVEIRQERRRHKNKESQQKSRKRKSTEVDSLQDENTSLREDNERLTHDVARLRRKLQALEAENKRLKLQHKSV